MLTQHTVFHLTQTAWYRKQHGLFSVCCSIVVLVGRKRKSQKNFHLDSSMSFVCFPENNTGVEMFSKRTTTNWLEWRVVVHRLLIQISFRCSMTLEVQHILQLFFLFFILPAFFTRPYKFCSCFGYSLHNRFAVLTLAIVAPTSSLDQREVHLLSSSATWGTIGGINIKL